VAVTDDHLGAADFPRSRQGYRRSAVDAHLRDVRRRLQELIRVRSEQADEIDRLTRTLAEVEARYDRLRTATPEEHAEEVLAAASDRAAALVRDAERTAARLVADAERRAEVIDERSRQEHAWRRRQLSREREALAQQKLAMRSQLRSFRALAVSTTSLLPELEVSLSDRHS
jgi:cell division septum initiation protein DivIVA